MLTHGGDIFGIAGQRNTELGKYLDFSANINPLGIPDGVKLAMQKGLEEAVYYPDPENRQLVEALSAKFLMKHEWFLCGNGAADLIYRLVYAEHPKKTVIPVPTFLEYEEALKQVGAQMIHVNLNQLAEQLDESVDMVFLCNPNNPTGLLLDSMLLETLIKKAHQYKIRLVIDECFLDFVEKEKHNSAIKYLEKYPELLILRSFTKMFAIPGIRLGYGISSDLELLERMKRAGQTWPVNSVAKAAGIAALQEDEFAARTVQYVAKERNFLKNGLKKIGAAVTDGEANFLFFHMPEIPNLYEELIKYRIIIRRCSNYRNLGACDYRIAVRTHEENTRLLNSYEQIMKNTECIR